MKILHVIATFSVDYPGGITNYVRTLAEAQTRNGNTVDVLDGGGEAPWRHHAQGVRVGSIASTNHPVHVVSSRADPTGTAEFLELVTREHYDVVHFHLTIGMGETLYEEMPALGVPYVVTLHDYFLFCPRITMMDWRGENCGGPEKRKCESCIGVLDQVDGLFRLSRKTGVPLPRVLPSPRVTRRNEKIHGFLRSARAVLAISSRVKAFFESRYPGVHCTLAHVGTNSAGTGAITKTTSDSLRLSFLGTLSRHKGADVLFELASRVTRKDVEFHFYGRPLGTGARAALEESSVIDHGPYVEEDLPSIMAETDLGLVLSVWEEGAGIVVMELLNFGTPVLATNRGGLPDFVNEQNGYLFEPTEEGIDAAVRFIEVLDRATLARLTRGITPLTTPDQHLERVMNAYRGEPHETHPDLC